MPLTRFVIIQGDEHLTSHSGLALIGALLKRSGLRAACDLMPGAVPKREGFSLGQLVTAMTGLICLGKPDFDAIEEQREQPFFTRSLGLPECPSAPTLRQRLQAAEGSLDGVVRRCSQDLVRQTASVISGVSTARHGELVPFEMDVVVFDNSKTKKEGLGWTYHRCMGFAPIFSHVGTEGYLVDVELRAGEKHSQSETTPVFLRASLEAARRMLPTDDPRKLAGRLDAGFDSQDNIAVFEATGDHYCISRNRRRESVAEWLEIGKNQGIASTPRPGKTVWLGEITKNMDGVSRRVVFEVTERTTEWTPDGFQELVVPIIDIESFWTDLTDTAADVIHFYHGRGTSEQFHSEIKTDLDLERLPSGTFATNQLVLLLGMLAYNCLRLMSQESLRNDPGIPELAKPPLRKLVKRRRVRSVMDDLMHLAARVIHTGRRWKLAFGRHAPWAATWHRLYGAFSIPAPN
jgi:hypothetical protein